MARAGFDFGAEVVSGGGKVFKTPEVGDHEAIVSAIVHVGSFQDVFTKGKAKEVKKPCNYVLVQATLMGDDDKNEDDSRMEQWLAIALKDGDKATLTKFMSAVDPKEECSGFSDFIGRAFTVSMVGSGKQGEDGKWQYVNWKGFAGCPDKLAKLVYAEVESEGIQCIGHVQFDGITKEILDAIPAYMVRQYFLSERDGDNLSYAGSKVEAIINKAREEDPDWKMPRKSDEDAKPDSKKPLDTGADVPAEVPAQDVPAPDLDETEEF